MTAAAKNDKGNAPPLIRDYDKGGFTIGDVFHPGGIVIKGADDSGFVIEPWAHPENPDALALEDFAPIFGGVRPDLILLGVGAVMSHPFAELRAAVSGAGVPLEVQTTPAICRTWNLVLSEGRRAALMAIPPMRLK